MVTAPRASLHHMTYDTFLTFFLYMVLCPCCVTHQYIYKIYAYILKNKFQNDINHIGILYRRQTMWKKGTYIYRYITLEDIDFLEPIKCRRK